MENKTEYFVPKVHCVEPSHAMQWKCGKGFNSLGGAVDHDIGVIQSCDKTKHS